MMTAHSTKVIGQTTSTMAEVLSSIQMGKSTMAIGKMARLADKERTSMRMGPATPASGIKIYSMDSAWRFGLKETASTHMLDHL